MVRLHRGQGAVHRDHGNEGRTNERNVGKSQIIELVQFGIGQKNVGLAFHQLLQIVGVVQAVIANGCLTLGVEKRGGDGGDGGDGAIGHDSVHLERCVGLNVVDALLGVVIGVHHLQGRGGEHVAGLGELDPAPVALQKRAAELLFHGHDVLGKRRLR